MFLPFDPIIALVVVAVAIACFALKGSPSSKKMGKSDEEFIKWLRKQEENRSPDNSRYQKWLYEHRK